MIAIYFPKGSEKLHLNNVAYLVVVSRNFFIYHSAEKIPLILEWSKSRACAPLHRVKELLLLFGVLTLFLLLVVALIYNTLVNRRNQVRYAFSCVDVQLKKRFDLVPNLVETVKGYAAHESELFTAVTRAREAVSNAGATWNQQEMLQQQVQMLMARAEAYPELRANEQFLMLQRQLSECEEQIAAARRAYNASVMDYQNSIGMFPSSLIASLFHFTAMPSFEAAIAERNNVNVTF